MKKKKLSEISKVSSLESGDRIMAVSSDMKTLMAASKSSVVTNLSITSLTGLGFTGNNGSDVFNQGQTLTSITNGVSLYGFPSDIGLLIHLQRLTKGDISSSQFVYQIFMSGSNVYYRNGSGNNTVVNYQPWKKIVLETV